MHSKLRYIFFLGIKQERDQENFRKFYKIVKPYESNGFLKLLIREIMKE